MAAVIASCATMPRIVVRGDARVVAAHVLDEEVIVHRRREHDAAEELHRLRFTVDQLVRDDDGRVAGVGADEHRRGQRVDGEEPGVGDHPQREADVDELKRGERDEREVEREGRQIARGQVLRRPAAVVDRREDRDHRERGYADVPGVRPGDDEAERQQRQREAEQVERPDLGVLQGRRGGRAFSGGGGEAHRSRAPLEQSHIRIGM